MSQTTTMTVAQAIAEGYTYCLQDGYQNVESIDDIDPDELAENTFWVCEKQSRSPAIAPSRIQQMIEEHFADQDQVADDQARLPKIIASLPVDTFQPLAETINQALSVFQYWRATDIQLVPC